MKPWMTTFALLAALLVESCTVPTSVNTPAGAAKPAPDFGNKAYGYRRSAVAVT